MARRAHTLALAACAAIAWRASVAPSARAETVYRAPSLCPNEDSVLARVPAGANATIDVIFDGANYVGTLRVLPRVAANAPFVRTLSAASCNVLVDAVLLVLQIESDRAQTSQAAEAQASPRTVATPGTVAAAPIPSVAPAATTPAAPTPAAPASVAAIVTRPKDRDSEPSAPLALSGSVALGVGSSIGLAPKPNLELGLFAEFGVRPVLGLAPMLRLGGRFSFPNSQALQTAALSPQPSAAFRSLRATVELCPVRLGVEFSVLPCIAQDLGTLRAEAQGFAGAATQTRTFAGTGVSLAFQLRPRRLRPLFFSLELAGYVPWGRLRFQLAGQELFATGAVYGSGLLSAGLAFQ
jgi:hypothetical protein